MARPKGKLLALVLMFIAIGGVLGTGAFTTVSAERTADVNVAGDSGALLALTAANSPNDAYFSNPDGEAEIDLSASGQGAQGVNQRAETDVRAVFTITNQGTQEVGIWIQTSDDDSNDNNDDSAGENDHVAFYSTDVSKTQAGSNAKAFTGGDLQKPGDKINLAGAADDGNDPVRLDDDDGSTFIELGAGESITVSIFVDLSPDDITQDQDVLDTVTINAEASLADGSDDLSGPE